MTARVQHLPAVQALFRDAEHVLGYDIKKALCSTPLASMTVAGLH